MKIVINSLNQNIRWILIFLFSFIVNHSNAHIHFMEYGNQLSNCSSIHTILQDSQGYIWISSDYGLNRILGNNIKVFVKQPNKSNSIPGNFVTCLYEDSQKTLWVGTSVGLSIYNPQKEDFIQFNAPAYLKVKGMSIDGIIEDKQKNIWVIINRESLMRINIATNNVTLIESNELKKISPQLLYVDDQNRIWLFGSHTNFGIFNSDKEEVEILSDYRNIPVNIRQKDFCAISTDNKKNILASTLDGGLYSINTNNFEIKLIEKANKLEISKNILSICTDKKGCIWIGTDGYGLWQYDETTQTLNPYELSNLGFNPKVGKIQSIYEDKERNIYIPFIEKGIAILSPNETGFNTIKNDIYSTKLNFCEHSILSLLIDKQNILWAGTNGGGLHLFQKKDNIYWVKDHLIPKEKVITCLYEDSIGRIFIGTYLHGFYIYDKGKIEHYTAGTEANSINNNHVISFSEDQNHNIWIVTNGGGISIMNSQKNIFKHLIDYKENVLPKSNMLHCLPNNYCNSIYWDQKRMWIGTSSGIACINPTNWKNDEYIEKEIKHLPHNCITINGDRNNTVLLGTSEGLYRLLVAANNVKSTKIDNYNLNSYIFSIEIENKNEYWISTDEALVHYNIANEELKSYNTSDGVMCLPFKGRSSTKGNDGTLFWGGNRGITYFNPNNKRKTSILPKVILCDLSLYDEHIGIDEPYDNNIILSQSLSFTKKIRLKNNQNKITINYNIPTFEYSDRVEYEYIMEGVDIQWQTNKNIHSVTYTNLKAGKYKFKIHTKHADLQGKDTVLEIIVDQPWWWSVWAKIIYSLITLTILGLVYRFTIIRLKEKKRLVEQEHQEQLAQSKLQFFTDISHEIRTPLTLVISPLQRLLDNESDTKKRKSLQIMNQNATRILRLINQLLDTRKIEKGQMRLKVSKIAINPFIEDIIQSFSLLAQEKKLILKYYIDSQLNDVWIDIDVIDKIIYNLLSNAFKFSSEGSIVLNVQTIENVFLEISVTDTGQGISKEEIDNIFERFYQSGYIGISKNSGTGIGLHLTKMLTLLHHGEIHVRSKVNAGSCFSIKIPFQKKDFQPEELDDNQAKQHYSTTSVELNYIEQDNIEMPHNTKRKRSRILIVEDSTDISELLKSELSDQYIILEAENGKEGYKTACLEQPDIIISDIMMPEMDGLQMTNKLKSNTITREIPIIILTAKTSEEDQVAGIKEGADAYINKPFNITFLKVNIQNLIYKYEVLKSHHSNTPEVETNDIELKSSDDFLIDRLNSIIKARISDPSLNIETLSAEYGISRVHLHRKLKEICHQTPSTYLRNIRLEYAANLLKEKDVAISQIAYAIGFNSHQYFSNRFKEKFGLSPYEYAEKYKKENAITKSND